MDNLRFPSVDSSTSRGLRSGAFSFVISLLIFGSGLIAVLNGVPGCTDAVIKFLQENALTLASAIGIPTGLVTFVISVLRPKTPNY